MSIDSYNASTDRRAVPLVGLDLTGRTALVTGGASGIGLACAARLVAAGARVTMVDIDGERMADQAGRIGAEPWLLDLSDTAGLAGLSLDVDILVNNAGLQRVAPIEKFDPDDFSRILRIMLEAPFLLTRAALPAMYERGFGRIVNISSVHGLRASPYKAAYVAAKHGLEGLSKVIALEGAPRGVTSNTVCPAFVRTPLVEAQIADQARLNDLDEAEVVEKIMLRETALKRLVEPDEVAEMVAYLCSPAAGFITGSSLCIDGGWLAR
ncbi:MAG TPA: 3-hydroxybutyrate dehydrogenase [Acidimicrobiales bacterium]|nr:3-hydroxybutyrate dehydrogenase [Acidimicrobiales bacterium]